MGNGTRHTLNETLDPEHFDERPIHSDCGDRCWWIRFEDGSQITVLDRETGFSDGYGWCRRDVETGYRSPTGKIWLASGGFDIRQIGQGGTYAQAIERIQRGANTHIPERDQPDEPV
jgi:hypothetical protein